MKEIVPKEDKNFVPFLVDNTKKMLDIDNKISDIEESIKEIKEKLKREKTLNTTLLKKIDELQIVLKIRNEDFDSMFLKIQELKNVYKNSLDKKTYILSLANDKNSINDIVNKIEDIEIKLLKAELNRVEQSEVFNKLDDKLDELLKEKKSLKRQKSKIKTYSKTINKFLNSKIANEDVFDVEVIGENRLLR